jgi:hypothetical protein
MLHHILWRDNEVANALAWLESSREPPPPGMLMQDLFKPSIRLEEDVLPPVPGISLGEDDLAPASRTLLGKYGVSLTSKANPGTSAGTIGQGWETVGEIETIVGPPSPDADWRRPFSEYIWLGTILYDETETQCLARRAMGYLIHNDELYHCSTSGILQRCNPTEEDKGLLLNVHKGVCGHHASSRSMIGKAFQQGFY